MHPVMSARKMAEIAFPIGPITDTVLQCKAFAVMHDALRHFAD